ncbi:MAG: hypothetical protein AAGI71_12420 [Bacteroidota bacterium]
MLILSLILAALAYGAFYVAAPGRQSKALGSVRLLLGLGTGLTVAGLGVSYLATESAVGPALVVTVMMLVASVLAITGPFFLPAAEVVGPRSPKTSAGGRAPKLPPSMPPAQRPKHPPTRPPSAP